jgi:REP element-mobilizing transposase RayT
MNVSICVLFLPSHVHFVFRSDNEEPSGLLRDFKGYTARKLIKEIEGNPQESRKEWLLWIMEKLVKRKAMFRKDSFGHNIINLLNYGVTKSLYKKYTANG